MAETRGEWCVSVYMPVSDADAKKNKLRLKNLMFEAEKKLLGLEVDPFKIARMLGPVEMIQDNPGFWKGRTEGFAAFFTPDSFVWYSLNYQFDELVVVTDRFHLKPLIRNALQNRRFYLLGLSQKRIKFFEASELGINEVHMKKIPKNLDYFLHPESTEAGLQSHTVGGGAAVFHGRGGAEENKKTRLLELFRKVDNAVTEHLKNDNAPLILGGVEFLHPIYKKANNYSHLLADGIHGNIDNMTPRELLEKSLPITQPVFRQTRESALELYREKLGTGLASENLSEIFKAAGNGRIEMLFVPVGKQEWGKFDSSSDELIVHDQPKPGDKDLLCVTSTRTLREGGEVFVMLPEQMPGASSVAAVLRY